MTRPADDLAGAVETLVARMRPDSPSCPDAEELIEYHLGKLPAAEENRLRDHLLVCPEDRALLLDLERLLSGDLGAERPVSEFEMAAARKGLRARIAARELSERPARPSSRSLPWLRTLAATLAIAVLGLAGWNLSLHKSLVETSRPQLNAKFIDLDAGVLRGGDPAVLTLAPEDRLFNVILHLQPSEEPDGEYRVEIVRGGESVWSGRGLRRNEYGTLSLALKRQPFGAGEYRIELYVAAEPRGEPAAEFVLRIDVTTEER